MDIIENNEQPKTVGQKIRETRLANNSYVTGTAKMLDTKAKNGTFQIAADKAAATCRERGITHENAKKAAASRIANGNLSMDAAVDAITKNWELINAAGEVFIIRNLEQFCRENQLDAATMSKVARGKRKSHKGWKCKHLVD
jgi:hypothetical protein